MIKPTCSKCQFVSNEAVVRKPCSCKPIFHRDMLCGAKENMIKDNITGEFHKPYCEEVNRYGECLAYKPVGLEAPIITVIDEDDTGSVVAITGKSPILYTTDGTEPTVKMVSVGEYDEEQELYFIAFDVKNTCVVKACCVIDGVLSSITEKSIEVPDTPVIEFDKETNTVTIKSFNKVYFTTDGSNVTEDSPVYDKPFVITHNTLVKAKSYAREDLSVQVERNCISIESPVIEFNPDTNLVTILADDTILYSLDGSDIYDDSSVYYEPIELTKNTMVKAACIVDGELSEQVEKECKVANTPVITYDEKTHKVTIESENPVHYTLDGSEVKKSSPVYTVPLTIKETCTVKAASDADGKLSQEASQECVVVAPPVITFDDEENLVTITGDNTILYSTDGSKIYDDSDEYLDPFVIDKNTTVKAACILNGILSEEVTLVCKVASKPTIAFNSTTKVVTITGENTILYTTDGSDVKKKDSEYKAPFKITQTTTVKAKSIVGDKLSEQAELTCNI